MKEGITIWAKNEKIRKEKERTKVRMKERKNKWKNEWMKERKKKERTNKWKNEWMKERKKERKQERGALRDLEIEENKRRWWGDWTVNEPA